MRSKKSKNRKYPRLILNNLKLTIEISNKMTIRLLNNKMINRMNQVCQDLLWVMFILKKMRRPVKMKFCKVERIIMLQIQLKEHLIDKT